MDNLLSNFTKLFMDTEPTEPCLNALVTYRKNVTQLGIAFSKYVSFKKSTYIGQGGQHERANLSAGVHARNGGSRALKYSIILYDLPQIECVIHFQMKMQKKQLGINENKQTNGSSGQSCLLDPNTFNWLILYSLPRFRSSLLPPPSSQRSIRVTSKYLTI